MIISKTPMRISFFGGGTDFPDYFKVRSGAVISTSINKYCYVHLRDLPQYFEYNSEIIYSKIERVKEVLEIQHPLVREALKYKLVDHVHLAYDADLPARTGLATSSAFSVGLLNVSLRANANLLMKLFFLNDTCATRLGESKIK